MGRAESARARWLTALLVSAGLVIAAPFVGDLQRWLLRTFGGAYVPVVNVAVGALTLAAVAGAIVRIREQRLVRYGLMAAACALAAAAAWSTGLASAESNAVERFHFVEYGLITWLFHRAAVQGGGRLLPLGAAAASAVAVAAGDEWLQHLAPGRVGEVRDIAMNAAAIGCGLLVSTAIAPRQVAPLRGLSRPFTIAVSAAVGLILSFVYVVHTGVRIDDGEVIFVSRFDPAGLARRDAAFTPAAPHGWIENQFVTEALWHVQERNTRWEAGDFAAAWGEHRILEKYFPTVLAAGHAWPPVQRADAERRLGPAGLPRPFRSRAERLPIWPLRSSRR